MPRLDHRARGFTLIEVLIAVAIIGILAAVAVPSYSAYVVKVRRTDATIFLTEAAGEQVRHRSERNAYADGLSELGYAADAVVTPEGFYTVSVDPAGTSDTAFELVAVPVAGTSQEGDAACGSFRITSTGRKYTSTGSDECW